MSTSYEQGLSSVTPPFKIVLSDHDGADIIAEFKKEVNKMLEEDECKYRPVPCYITTGVLGNMRAEMVIVYIYAGIPFILAPLLCIEGYDATHAKMAPGGYFISRMYEKDNTRAFSLGYVDKPSQVYKYAKEYTKKNPIIDSIDIDEKVINTYIVNNIKTVKSVGTIYRVGGSRFEVYGFDTDESRMIRTTKDFVGGNPYIENGIPEGKTEVILYGGNPDIVQLGDFCTKDGNIFGVWVPNGEKFVKKGSEILTKFILPNDIFVVDEDELAEVYAMAGMYLEKLDAAEDEEPEDESDVPDIEPEDIFEN